MKIRIEIDDRIEENEIVIRCNEIDDEVQRLQKLFSTSSNDSKSILCFKDKTKCYVSLHSILFFETEEDIVKLHTSDNMYSVKEKLYELEETLPVSFMRISKSAIVNTKMIFAIDKNITSTSVIHFRNSHKVVYLSRRYYQVLKDRMEEKRLKK